MQKYENLNSAITFVQDLLRYNNVNSDLYGIYLLTLHLLIETTSVTSCYHQLLG